MQEFKIGEADVGKRTDVFVAEKYPDFSRSSLRTLFEQKLITVNSKPEEPGDKLKAGDLVSVDVSLLNQIPEELNLPTLYEDSEVIVVNKPSGVLTHSKGALNTEATYASFLKPRITDKTLTGNRAGVAHRLDRLTSGVIIGAKTSDALKHLQKQFSTRKVIKTYLAVVEGIPAQQAAIIDAPIGRNPARPQTFKVISGGKTARTGYKTLKSFDKAGKTYSLIKLTPVTGRTHQIRVHLAYIGHPVVGDTVYGLKNQTAPFLLHASSLKLKLPGGEIKQFQAPPPSLLKEFLK